MMRYVRRARSSASATAESDPPSRLTSAAARATSVPPPIATPTSAFASAGASFSPSPTKTTRCPVALQAFHLRRPCHRGRPRPTTRSMPVSAATASAVARRSPVTSATCMPIARSRVDGLGGLRLHAVGDRDDAHGQPVAPHGERGPPLRGERRHRRAPAPGAARRGGPRRISTPSTTARAPVPGSTVCSAPAGIAIPRSRARIEHGAGRSGAPSPPPPRRRWRAPRRPRRRRPAPPRRGASRPR